MRKVTDGEYWLRYRAEQAKTILEEQQRAAGEGPLDAIADGDPTALMYQYSWNEHTAFRGDSKRFGEWMRYSMQYNNKLKVMNPDGTWRERRWSPYELGK